MKIYLKTGKRDHLMFVTPGNESTVETKGEGEKPSEWQNPDGTNKQFTVRFVDGKAEVPRNLGAYLIHKGLAQSSSIIAPSMAKTLDVLDERVRNHRLLTADFHH